MGEVPDGDDTEAGGMSTHIPGKHIDGMVKAFGHTDPSVPAGWTREAWQAYLDDPDGGRAAIRAIRRENFHAAIERDADDWRVD